jgi:uncharacterized protein YgbK (DUF1537 family)
MTNHTVANASGKMVVKIAEQGGRFNSRLYVNGGETATLVTAKAKTFTGAQKQAVKMLANHDA